jgi:hypothetical protein
VSRVRKTLCCASRRMSKLYSYKKEPLCPCFLFINTNKLLCVFECYIMYVIKVSSWLINSILLNWRIYDSFLVMIEIWLRVSHMKQIMRVIYGIQGIFRQNNDKLMYSNHAKMTFLEVLRTLFCLNSIYFGFEALIYLYMLNKI